MNYRVNEIFTSLQGEGFHSGTAAIFIRFSGCNLRCPFCDTDFSAFSTMSLEDILSFVEREPVKFVVLTGGEPSLQADDALVDGLHRAGKWVAMETNGTHALPNGIDWITLSPKNDHVSGAELRLKECDELKIVYTGETFSTFPDISATHRFLQPCDTGNRARNEALMREAAAWCLKHPEWRLSLQIHKIIGIR